FFNTENGKLKNNFVAAILEDRNGRLWVGTNGGGISILDKTKTEVEIDNIEPKASVRTLLEDIDGKIWIGGYYGIQIYNPLLKNFTYLDPDNSDTDEILNCIFKDSHDNIWVGTMGKGLQL